MDHHVSRDGRKRLVTLVSKYYTVKDVNTTEKLHSPAVLFSDHNLIKKVS
jgi:hypothetical protein